MHFVESSWLASLEATRHLRKVQLNLLSKTILFQFVLILLTAINFIYWFISTRRSGWEHPVPAQGIPFAPGLLEIKRAGMGLG